jgi:uncharacterized protein YyaL (SSP411 family)
MPNSLASETSPYLLQHAGNPVDWMPWGEAAFAKARAGEKLIFLSIGYSTCHWCHVMERESFENEATAALMNEHFVCIKVDREERPDLDATYMMFVMATTGHGGWPMSVWLTPELLPVYGGTYYPPEDRSGRAGFPTVLRRVAKAWDEQRDDIRAGAAKALELISTAHHPRGRAEALPGEDVFVAAFEQSARAYDPDFGGFGAPPKFPRASLFLLLARLASRFGAGSQRGQRCGHMLAHTLAAMAQGGLHDHLGGGFHRYSVDGYWHVPHFEKMLYDQAQLAVNYLEAWQLTGDPLFRGVAERTLDYVRRDLTDPDGGFHSAEDADSLPEAGAAEKVEGGFYTWTRDEIERRLRPELARFFIWFYWIKPDGNARPESDPLGELKGRNTLFVAHDVGEAAIHFAVTREQIIEWIVEAHAELLKARSERPRPHKDDKIVTAWNGLMISAFVRAAAAWGRNGDRESAWRALGFARQSLFDADTGTLRRSWRHGPGPAPGFAADYAFLIQACLDGYEAMGEVSWLEWAVALQTTFDRDFWDDGRGGYVTAPHGLTDTLVPVVEYPDGAEPAANSVAALNLLRLAAMLDHRIWRERAETLLLSLGEVLKENPYGVPCLAVALDFALAAPQQVVITGGAGHAAMLAAVHHGFRPHRVVLHADGGRGQDFLAGHVPAIGAMKPIDGKATAYVCRDFTCHEPVTDPAAFQAAAGG